MENDADSTVWCTGGECCRGVVDVDNHTGGKDGMHGVCKESRGELGVDECGLCEARVGQQVLVIYEETPSPQDLPWLARMPTPLPHLVKMILAGVDACLHCTKGYPDWPAHLSPTIMMICLGQKIW